MTITEIRNIFNSGNDYTWSLFFFTINKKANNPYKAYKIKMKDPNLIVNYANNLLGCVKNAQLDKIENIEDYDGDNPNLTCDKIETTNDLIKTNWNNLIEQIAQPTTTDIKNKVKGYVLLGQPKNEDVPSFSLFKMANPIFNVNDRKSQVFKKTDNELDPFTDYLYRLYLNVDFFVINNTLYALNYKFEETFDLEKTLQKLKMDTIDRIIETGCFNGEEFKDYANSYSHPKTFITLSEERLNKLKDGRQRANIGKMLKLSMNENNEFINLTNEQSLRLIKYLCYKIMKDGESGFLFEVSQAVKLDV